MNDGEPQDSEFIEINLVPPIEDDVGDDGAEEHDDDGAKGGEGGEGAEDASGEHADGEGDGDGEGELPEERKPAKGAEARIAELTRLRRQAERERDTAIAELHAARDPAKAAASKPTPDDFEDYGEFVEALTDWKAEQRDASRADTRASQAAENAAEHRNSEWGAKVAAISATIPDYAEVAGKSDILIRDHVAEAIQDADRGPELVYHLAQNPEVAARLNDMSANRAAIELGKIEATLGEAKAPEPEPKPAKKTTTAPAPITPVKSGSTNAKDPAKMNMEEYKAYRTAQGITR